MLQTNICSKAYITDIKCLLTWSMIMMFAFLLLETAFFNAQTIREIKIENRKLGGKKKGFLSFYSVCMFVCVFVCLSVIGLQTLSINIGV